MTLRVIAAEDTDISRLFIVAQLTNLGYDVTVVENGVELLHALDRDDYDLVLIDCQMPVMDGYQTTRHIRARPGADRDIPIIGITAHALPGDRERCLEAGMDDYIAKPVKQSLLAEVLRRWELRIARRASSDDKVLDASAHAHVRDSLASGPQILAAMIDLFLAEAPDQIEAILDANARRDLAVIRKLAHALRSGCANLGAASMLALLDRIETCARAGDAIEVALLTQRLPREFDRAFSALRRVRASLGNS